MIRVLSVIVLFANLVVAEITHEDQFEPKKIKVWASDGSDSHGEYTALEGDHTGTASIHIRLYAEEDTLYLWFTHIAQNDLAVLPEHQVYPKYERTRTDGTWKAHDKLEYIRFVTIGSVKGVIFGGRFYKKQTLDSMPD